MSHALFRCIESLLFSFFKVHKSSMALVCLLSPKLCPLNSLIETLRIVIRKFTALTIYRLVYCQEGFKFFEFKVRSNC